MIKKKMKKQTYWFLVNEAGGILSQVKSREEGEKMAKNYATDDPEEDYWVCRAVSVARSSAIVTLEKLDG